MSYVALNPSYYQMLQPESAWHAGAPGWSEAPYPGWGENPNLVGPRRLAVEGLGDDANPDVVSRADYIRAKDEAFVIGIGCGVVAGAAAFAAIEFLVKRM